MLWGAVRRLFAAFLGAWLLSADQFFIVGGWLPVMFWLVPAAIFKGAPD
jgi:hypothetical protein